MKNKKGFTLIEIIVCITLISIIGITSTIVVIKTKNNSSNSNILNGTKMSTKLSNITNKILEAANVYIAVEKDGNGNTYETGIKNGGKGLYIKVQTLVDSGYLDKSILNNLVKETDKKENELQLLAVDAVNKKDDKLCNTSNAIEYTVSWSNDNDKPIYLCPYDKNSNSTTKTLTIKEMMNNAKFSNNIGKSAVSQEWCDKNPDVDKSNIVCDENGLFIDRDKTNNVTYYYYRGAVNNNYIKFANKIWRILWINSENKAKLILEDPINIKVKNLVGTDLTIDKDDTLSYVYIRNVENRPGDDEHYDLSNMVSKEYVILNKSQGNSDSNNGYSLNFANVFSECSKTGIDCTNSDGNPYGGVGKADYLYQNLDKSYYLDGDSSKFNPLSCPYRSTECVMNSNIYENTLNEFLDSIKNDTQFKKMSQREEWNMFKVDYQNKKSKYYWNGHYPNSSDITSKIINSYEMDENSFYKSGYRKSYLGYINYHELVMAGITETTINSSDNYLVKNKNNYVIADYYYYSTSKNYNDMKWNYVDGETGKIYYYQILKSTSKNERFQHIFIRTYDQNKTSDSCKKTVWLNGNKYCDNIPVNSDGTLYLGGHAKDNIDLYSFKANTIKPVTIISLKNYKLSNASGTKEDPYTLTN